MKLLPSASLRSSACFGETVSKPLNDESITMSLPAAVPTMMRLRESTYSSCSSVRSSVSRYGMSSVTISAGGAAAAMIADRAGRRSCPHSWQKFSLQSLTVEQLGQVSVLGVAAATAGAAAAAMGTTVADTGVASVVVDA